MIMKGLLIASLFLICIFYMLFHFEKLHFTKMLRFPSSTSSSSSSSSQMDSTERDASSPMDSQEFTSLLPSNQNADFTTVGAESQSSTPPLMVDDATPAWSISKATKPAVVPESWEELAGLRSDDVLLGGTLGGLESTPNVEKDDSMLLPVQSVRIGDRVGQLVGGVTFPDMRESSSASDSPNSASNPLNAKSNLDNLALGVAKSTAKRFDVGSGSSGINSEGTTAGDEGETARAATASAAKKSSDGEDEESVLLISAGRQMNTSYGMSVVYPIQQIKVRGSIKVLNFTRK